MAQLHTKDWLEKNIEDLQVWQKEAFLAFEDIVADKENTYPCVLGRQGFLSGHLRFGFVGDPREKDSVRDLAALLGKYGEIAKDTGPYASLIIFFNTSKEMAETHSCEGYEDLFWSILNALTEQDPDSWPDGIASDPSHYSWEFCFRKEPYFSFCSTPAHQSRKSRYFPCFMIAFQPRWVFEGMNDTTPFGRKIKEQIRKRLEEYDHIAPHPVLKWYGQKDNLEWKQYFLRDDSSSLPRCPFSRKH